jgi:arsenate reductase
MSVTIYHNPRCSKSRQTKALLEERGVGVQVVEYLKEVPDVATLRTLVEQLGITPHAVLRTKEAAYAEAGLSADSDADTIYAAIVAHPVLLERPIVVANGKATIGRPPENVLAIL